MISGCKICTLKHQTCSSDFSNKNIESYARAGQIYVAFLCNKDATVLHFVLRDL